MKGTNKMCRFIATLCSLLLFAGVAMAQTQIIGTVVDAQGEPVVGASVIEQGTTNGAITDIDG